MGFCAGYGRASLYVLLASLMPAGASCTSRVATSKRSGAKAPLQPADQSLPEAPKFSISSPLGLMNTLTPEVTWSAVAGADSYELLVGTEATCSDQPKVDTLLKETSLKLPPLSDGEFYLCLYVSVGGIKTPALNSGAAVQIDTKGPATFAITSLDGLVRPKPTITWDAAAEAVAYDLKIASDAACTNILQSDTGIKTPSLTLTKALTSDAYACLSASDAAGNVTAAANNGVKLTLAKQIVLGQPDAVSTAVVDPPNAATLHVGRSIAVAGGRMIVADTNNHRVLIWSEIPNETGKPADLVVGQPDMAGKLANNGGLSAFSFNNPMNVASDGTHLCVSDFSNYRVLIWNSIPTVNNAPADVVLGQADMTASGYQSSHLDAKTINGAQYCYFHGGQFFVADSFNHRVLIWNSVPTVNQQPADVVLGQSSMATGAANTGGVSASTFNLPSSIVVVGSRLYVGDYSNFRVLFWNSVPKTNGVPADGVLGQASMTDAICHVSSGDVTARDFCNLALATDGVRLIGADTWNNRLVIWNEAPSTDHAAADLILGQPDAVSNNANAGHIAIDTMNVPYDVYSDGTRIYVADVSNNRITALLLP